MKIKTPVFQLYIKELKTLIEATVGKSRLLPDLKSSIDLASSLALENSFQAKYSDFPRFKNKITIENRAGVLKE